MVEVAHLMMDWRAMPRLLERSAMRYATVLVRAPGRVVAPDVLEAAALQLLLLLLTGARLLRTTSLVQWPL